MSSEINDQAVKVNQIVIPVGKGIKANVDPSLPPLNGALAQDVTEAGTLYIGDGNAWSLVASDSGVAEASSSTASQFTMTASNGSPSFANCALACQKIKISGLSFVFLELTINATSAGASTPEVWTSGSGVIPPTFRPPPSIVYQFPGVVFQGTYKNGTTAFIPLQNGAVQLQVSGTTATTNLIAYTYNAFYAV